MDSTTLINLEHVQRWLHICKASHGGSCNERYTRLLSQQLECLNLIDVSNGSLVTLPSSTPFVSLSYVWGDVPVFKATKSNQHILRRQGALLGLHPEVVIPDTIRDAIYLVKELGERYLWVDRICVLQDAEAHEMDDTLSAMARIYAAAEFTIVDAGGKNAQYGLRGIGGPSRGRTQNDITDNDHDHGYPWESKWASRGWTFQEGLFSRRMLIFHGKVSWVCGQRVWTEGLRGMSGEMAETEQALPLVRPEERPHLGVPMGIMSLLPTIPSLGRWGMLVETFSSRSLTFEADHQRAFAGATEVMSGTFPGGILHGLPEFFFDIALLWQPKASLQRRHEDTPSWSWTGWRGEVKCLMQWYPFHAGVYRKSDHYSSWVDVAHLKPTAQIFKRRLHSGELVLLRNDFYQYQAFRSDPSAELPEGWHRQYHPDGDFFTYSLQERKSTYSYPLPPVDKSHIPPHVEPFSHILRVTAPFLSLHIGHAFHDTSDLIFAHIITPSEVIVGCLSYMPLDLTPGTVIDLFAISEAEVAHPDRLADVGDYYPLAWDVGQWEAAREEDGTLAFYNVLWLVKQGDTMYRRGLGTVGKKAWDMLEPTVISFELG